MTVGWLVDFDSRCPLYYGTVMPDKHLTATPDALGGRTLVEFKAHLWLIGDSAAQTANAFKQLSFSMEVCRAEWQRFLGRHRPWYNRLRWRLDDWVKSHPRLSSLRSVRRFRVYVERLVAELNGYDSEDRL